MRPEDVGPAAERLRAGDFGDREGFFAWAIDQPFIELLVAVDGERIVGTGTGSAHGGAGWVGVIFVEAAARGGGLGRRITRRVIEGLEDRGCRTQVLIASPMGRPIYEREGFRELGRQVRFSIDGLAADDGAQDPAIRPFTAADRPAVVALDRWATGEDRRPVLDALVDAGDDAPCHGSIRQRARLPGPDPVARRRPDRRRPRPRRPPARAPPPLDRDQRQGGSRRPRLERARPGGAPGGWLARGAGERPDDPRRAPRLASGGIFGQFNGALG